MNKRAIVTLAAFLALAGNGLVFTFLGTSLPVVQLHLGIHIGQAGTLMAVLQTGFTAFSLIGGILSDCFRRERVLVAGTLSLGLAALVFGFNTSYLFNLLIAGLMGAGMGLTLSGSNSLLIGLYPARKGAILNIHHVFFGLGSFLGPLLMGFLLTQGEEWRSAYIGEAIVLLVLSVVFLISGGERPVPRTDNIFGKQLPALLKDKLFLVILTMNTLAVGTQVTLLLFGVSFLVQAKGTSFALAAGTLSIFSACIIVGRLICSRLTVTINHATIILALLWLQSTALLFTWLADGKYAIASMALSGFAFSGIYPTSLALCGIFFPGVQGSALGIMSTVCGGGSILLCWLFGDIASLLNMKGGFSVLVLASFGALIIFQLFHGPLTRRESITSRIRTT